MCVSVFLFFVLNKSYPDGILPVNIWNITLTVMIYDTNSNRFIQIYSLRTPGINTIYIFIIPFQRIIRNNSLFLRIHLF